MRIVCDGADLADAVLKVSKGTSNKTTNPILEGIKVVAEEDFVTLSATDLELSIEKTIRGMVHLEGEMVVPGKFFCEYIKKLNNEQIELAVDEKNMLSIKYTDSVGKIQCMNSSEFPEIKKLEDEANIAREKNDFNTAIKRYEWIIDRYEELGNTLAVNQYRALIDEFRENGTISIQAINNAGKTSTRPVNSATTTIKVDFPTNATLRRRRNR